MLLGVHLTLLIGPTIAVPAPIVLTEALASAQVTQNESGRSGFQLTFQVGRSGPLDLAEFNLLKNPLIRPFNRVCLMVRFNLLPKVLIDGFITQVQLTPSEQPGSSTLSITGEDVSVMMDLEQKTFPFPAQPEIVQVAAVLAKYPLSGWTGAIVLPPTVPDFPLPTKEVPIQNVTDYQHLTQLAAKHGYVFYIRPGAVPNTNIPYWGPAVPPDALAQAALSPALSVNMGPQTNVNSINFTYDALAQEMVVGEIVEPDFNVTIPVIFPPFSTSVPLAPMPAAIYQAGTTRISRMDVKAPKNDADMSDDARDQARVEYGKSVAQAYELARSKVNDSANRVVTVNGELDALRYGSALEARSVIGLRGVGFSYDGLYFVKSVTHTIKKGEYKQKFALRREGLGPMLPLVRP